MFYNGHLLVSFSVQQIVFFTAKRKRNRFVEPASLQIGNGIECKFFNLRIGIVLVFGRWKVVANFS